MPFPSCFVPRASTLCALLALACSSPGAVSPSARSVGSPRAASGPEDRLLARPPHSAEELASATGLFELALSPDGRTLAFVGDRTGARELWTAAVTEEGVTGPVQRTSFNERVSELTWSPGGDLLFAVDTGGDERPDFWTLGAGANAPVRLAQTALAEASPRYSPDGKSLAFLADPDRPFRFNLHVRDLATGRVRQLTREPINVMSPRWSPDGKTIVATVTPDWQKGELLVVSVLRGEVKRIKPARPEGILWPVDFLPDGRLLAITVNERGFEQLCHVSVELGTVELVGPGDWGVEHVEVVDDGTVVFSRNVGGESEVSIAPEGDFDAASVISKGGVLSDLSVARRTGALAFIRETATVPGQVMFQAPGVGVLVEAVGPDGAARSWSDLADAEHFTYASFDGRAMDAWLLRPPVERLGSPPPAVALAHGGPGGQCRPDFNMGAQALAEAGFVVVCVNYRGSSGFGYAFLDLDNKDWGGGDLEDIVTAIDALAHVDRLDGKRVGFTGASFGGYMTLRALTAKPMRWAAGVDCFGMPDLVEDYRLTVDRFGSWYETEMGTPTTHAQLFHDRSPIHFLDQVRAPLLVLQGANDTNVPKAESDLVVESLRRRGASVEYVLYENEGHGFTRRENRLDAAKRTVEFFVQHMGTPP